MSEEKLFSSTELTTATGCTRKALRYYQSKGLIHTARERGNRRYDESAFHRLRLIVGLRDSGMNIEDIARLIHLHDQNGVAASGTADALVQELDRLIDSVGERIESLRRIRHRLVGSRETLHGCRTCDLSLDNCIQCVESGKLDSTSRALMTNA